MKPYDANNYDEFIERLELFLEKCLKIGEGKKFKTSGKSMYNKDELKSKSSYIGDFYYKAYRAYLELNIFVDKNKNDGYFSLDVKAIHSDILRLYGEECKISVTNMKADFKNILKLAEKIVFNIKDNKTI